MKRFFLPTLMGRAFTPETCLGYATDWASVELHIVGTVSGRHSQGPPFPASVVIFIMLMLLHTKEVLINKKLG